MVDGVDDKQRIAELEAEVAALRAQRNDVAVAGAVRDDTTAGGVPEDGFLPASRRKVVALAALIVVVALTLVIAVFQAISAGINSAAPKAADYFSPDEQQRGAASQQPPAPATPPDVPRAPGL